MYVVLSLLSLCPLFVVGQLSWIHFVEGEELRDVGRRQANSQRVLPAKRGVILDQAGRALAVNTPRYELALDPLYPGFEESREAHVARIAQVTGWHAWRIDSRIDRRSSPQYVRLGPVSSAQFEQLDTLTVPGLIIEESFDRQYNFGGTAAHILGHVDRDGVGQAGLELTYDEYLQGIPGRRTLLRDRRGVRRVDAAGLVVPPVDGQVLVLTVDLIRQTILEEELERGVREARASRASAVAVDPNTGAILAMANWPTFDSNDPAASPPHTWRNAAITDRMEPGSAFKLIGATAAIELGRTSMDRMVDTGEGWINIYGRTMRDVHKHGEITFSDVLTLSSNVGMAKTAQLLAPGELYRYARDFGYGQRTWVDLPGEVAGLLKRTSRWSATTLTSLAIGYEVDVTPLQMVMAYAALANGGLLLQPYVVQERRDVTGRVLWRASDAPARRDSVRRVMNASTAHTLLPAFTGVVERGTATTAQVDGLSVAGKTGTSRKVTGGRYRGGYRATFVGFYPADDPQVAMIVVMDEPRRSIYGGQVSAPVFKRVAERWIGTLPAVAGQLLASSAAFDETSTAVLPSLPRPSSTNEQEVLVGDVPANTMPDFTGLSARAARRMLGQRGLQGTLHGSGQVVEQFPAAGDSSHHEVVLTLR